MNAAMTTRADWRRLRESPHWRDSQPPLFPDLEVATLRMTAECYADADLPALEARLSGFQAREGWIERQSGLVYWTDGEPPPAPDGEYDGLVAAELAKAGEGLTLRVTAAGWCVTHFQDEDDPAGADLRHDVVLAGVDRLPATRQVLGRRLRYRVYWRHDDEFGWRQVAARLLGFEGGKQ